jgi:hypothetical protein
MTVQTEVALLAQEFWRRVGESYTFPRNIERAAMTALPVVIVKIPRLTTRAVLTWFEARSAVVKVPPSPEGMVGCLVAHRGKAVIFVDGTDNDQEQRATIAHEIAHFLRHYQSIRDRAIRTLGPSVVEVLDGDRPPTFAERAKSVLHDAPIGVHVHVLSRVDRVDLVAKVEREADELALELIAPFQAARLLLNGAPSSSPVAQRTALSRHFGLPEQCFHAYAPNVAPPRVDPLGAIIGKLRGQE